MGIAYIIDAVRTPRGRGKKGVGRLSGLHPQELLGQALNGLRRTDFEPKDVEDVVTLLQVQTANIDLARVRRTLQMLESALGQSDLIPALDRAIADARRQ
jgi:acetyl-CoA acetyltransferase